MIICFFFVFFYTCQKHVPGFLFDSWLALIMWYSKTMNRMSLCWRKWDLKNQRSVSERQAPNNKAAGVQAEAVFICIQLTAELKHKILVFQNTRRGGSFRGQVEERHHTGSFEMNNQLFLIGRGSAWFTWSVQFKRDHLRTFRFTFNVSVISLFTRLFFFTL